MKWSKGTGGPAGDECQNLVAFHATGGSRDLSAGPLSPPSEVGSGVGIPSPPAVAFHATQDPISGEVCPALGTTSGGTAGVAHPAAFLVHGSRCAEVASPSGVAASLRCRAPGQQENGTTTVAVSGLTVRRLTPTECLRLQGMPTDIRQVMVIRLCSDQQKLDVLAETACPRWQSSVCNAFWPEDPIRWQATAPFAGGDFQPKPLSVAERAALLAETSFGDDGLRLSNWPDGQPLFAGSVEKTVEFPDAGPTVSFARTIARISSIAGRITATGRADALRSSEGFTALPNGCLCLVVSESETGTPASVVEQFTSKGLESDLFRFITSGVISTSLNLDWTLKTLCFSVARAVSSLVQTPIPNPNSFDVILSIRSNWLDLDPPLSDSRKYHMIGNGGARPVVEWIAARLAAAESRPAAGEGE